MGAHKIAIKPLPSPRGWLGPHFYYDIIRLARRGWPTLVRVLYLVVLLISLTVMNRMHGGDVLVKPFEYALYAHGYAYTLIVLQNLLVLVLLPVYVASAIAEERERQTLEALSLTHLTDRELVIGKLGARLVSLGAIVLSSFPLLVFMHLWGNVDVLFLAYHELNTLLILISAGSLCIWVSASADGVFQAITRSYPWLALLGVFALAAAFLLPRWIIGAFAMLITVGRLGTPEPFYFLALPLLAIGHLTIAIITLHEAVNVMEFKRREERRGLRKNIGALSLADEVQKLPERAGKRGEVRSRIHPWARRIRGDALFWKECIKDGSSWSLSTRWLVVGLGIILVWAAIHHTLSAGAISGGRDFLRSNAYSFCFTNYVIALAAYALVVLFQMTMSVAGEREHGTLTFLLQVPEDRAHILRAKWLGPWWRNWPILALSYGGMLLGLACGLFGPLTALIMIVLPWPLLLMLGGLALWLSVICRRVLFANIALVGVMGLLFIAHVAAGRLTRVIFSFYIALLGEVPIGQVIAKVSWEDAVVPALLEQASFLLVAALCLRGAFRRFADRNYVFA
jgi:ABC-type transport system involved in multi-copper enzyme maturation permease subunit